MADHRVPRIYTIGPFRAATELGRRQHIARAEALALDIGRVGAYYRCPHLHSAHFEGQLSDEYWLGLGIDLLSECDAAALVPDFNLAFSGEPWRDYLRPEQPHVSHGSIAEVAWCEVHGLPVLRDLDEIRAFIRGYLAGDRWRIEEWRKERDRKRHEDLEQQWAEDEQQ